MFAIYKPESGKDSREYAFSRKIQSGDRTVARALYDLIDTQAGTAGALKDKRMSWEITGQNLLWEVLKDQEKSEKGKYKLIIDAMPNNVGPQRETQLFEMCHIWGCTDPGWTPLLLRLDLRFEGERETVEQTRFTYDTEPAPATESVYEFLHLRWGYESGRKTREERRKSGEVRNWGRVGFTNGTLLWPPHFEHLLSRIGYNRAQDSHPTPPCKAGFAGSR
jgi:hypothetical protein